jgi:hypothetical protein
VAGGTEQQSSTAPSIMGTIAALTAHRTSTPAAAYPERLKCPRATRGRYAGATHMSSRRLSRLLFRVSRRRPPSTSISTPLTPAHGDERLRVVADGGSGSASTQPGTHWITAVERASNKAANAALLVQTDWPASPCPRAHRRQPAREHAEHVQRSRTGHPVDRRDRGDSVVTGGRQRAYLHWRTRAGRISYAEWSRRYFSDALHQRSTTLARDEVVNERHFIATIGDRPLFSLTPHEVRRIVGTMSKRLAPSPVRTNYGVFRAVVNAAVAADILSVSPCRGIKLPPNRRRELRPITAEQLDVLAKAMPAGTDVSHTSRVCSACVGARSPVASRSD